MNLIVEAPLNSLSFGNVSYNFLRELYKANIDIALFPIGEPDLSAFQPTQEFVNWLQKSISVRFDALSKNLPTLKLWHLNGSDTLRSRNQTLVTFYECNKPTNIEKNIANLQSKTLFSSQYASSQFEGSDTFKLGFDEDFKVTGKTYLKDRIHFGLCGKFEKRKHTEKLIKTWSLDCYPYHSKFIIKLITLKGRTKFILLDKNNCINITTDFNINDKQECKQININSHWTLNNILTQTLNRIGNNNFFNWNICKNNCLVFSREILTTLNKLNKSNTTFLSCDKIFGHLEMTEFTLHTINCLNVILNVVEKYIFDNSILNC